MCLSRNKNLIVTIAKHRVITLAKNIPLKALVPGR